MAALLDPATYVGLAPAIVERVLAATRASGWIKALRFIGGRPDIAQTARQGRF